MSPRNSDTNSALTRHENAMLSSIKFKQETACSSIMLKACTPCAIADSMLIWTFISSLSLSELSSIYSMTSCCDLRAHAYPNRFQIKTGAGVSRPIQTTGAFRNWDIVVVLLFNDRALFRHGTIQQPLCFHAATVHKMCIEHATIVMVNLFMSNFSLSPTLFLLHIRPIDAGFKLVVNLAF